jgi:hypothetical protein
MCSLLDEQCEQEVSRADLLVTKSIRLCCRTLKYGSKRSPKPHVGTQREAWIALECRCDPISKLWKTRPRRHARQHRSRCGL